MEETQAPDAPDLSPAGVLEIVAAKMHEHWLGAERDRGTISVETPELGERMRPYADLSDRAKEMLRETARPVLAAIEAAGLVVTTPDEHSMLRMLMRHTEVATAQALRAQGIIIEQCQKQIALQHGQNAEQQSHVLDTQTEMLRLLSRTMEREHQTRAVLFGAIERDPGRCCGKAVVAGTSYPVGLFLGHLASDALITELADSHAAPKEALVRVLHSLANLLDGTPDSARASTSSDAIPITWPAEHLRTAEAKEELGRWLAGIFDRGRIQQLRLYQGVSPAEGRPGTTSQLLTQLRHPDDFEDRGPDDIAAVLVEHARTAITAERASREPLFDCFEIRAYLPLHEEKHFAQFRFRLA